MRTVRFGVIGGGLMGREFASAAARWLHLADMRRAARRSCTSATPTPTCSPGTSGSSPTPRLSTDWGDLLDDPDVEAVYCAVPHHLHAELYVAILEAGRHLLGEKPFGIDLDANKRIMAAVASHPELLVRCSSEMPFFPGGQAVARWLAEGRAGRILEVRSQFLHSSDLDPEQADQLEAPGRVQRRVRLHGRPRHARAAPAAAVRDDAAQRPRAALGRRDRAARAPTARWCRATRRTTRSCCARRASFPLRIETKRIAPGEMNTWVIEIDGTEGSIAFTTKTPKTLRVMEYEPGGPQEWRVTDLGSQSAYPTITGGIFEFGFSDAIQQMWAAFVDELAHGADMRGPFRCATPEEAAATHRIFTAALESDRTGTVVKL